MSTKRLLQNATRLTLALAVAFFPSIYLIWPSEPEFAIFATITTIFLILIAHFGGPPRQRVLANLLTAGVGGLLAFFGTVVSGHTNIVAILMFVIGFGLGMIGSLSGYLAAATVPLVLYFLMGSAIPGDVANGFVRLLGVLYGGALSTAATLWLWPESTRQDFRLALADAFDSLAELILFLKANEKHEKPLPDVRERVWKSVAGLREYMAGMEYAPVGNTNKDRAQWALLHTVDRLTRLIGRTVEAVGGATSDAAKAVVDKLHGVLDDSAAALRNERPPPDEQNALDVADLFADQSDQIIDRVIAADVVSDEAATVMTRQFVLRDLAQTIASSVAHVRIACGATSQIFQYGDEPLHALRASLRKLRSDLSLSSINFRNALRVAVGLSVATILGYLFDPEKGYWVVLTILVVMRSNAGGTWVAAVQRIIGTAIGFGIATGIIEAAGDTTVVYAVLLPVLAFGVVIVMALGHPILGAALITTMILILFNIMAPTGWEIGLLRVRDTAIGAAIGLAIGLLMWPQGASGLLRKALARGFDASARYLRTTFTAKSAGAPPDTDARDAALVNADRAEQVYQQYLGETGEKPVPPELYLKLLIANERLWYSTLLVDKRAPDGTIGVCPPVVTELNGTVGELDAGFTAIARALRASRPEGSPKAEAATAEQLAPLSQSSLDCLQSASGERSRVVYLLLMRYWLLSLVDNLHDAQVCIPANGDGVRILGTDDRGISSTTAH